MITRLVSAITNNPMVLVYIAGIAFVLGLGCGAYPAWMINGWRLGIKVAQVEKERDAAIAQGNINAAAANDCSANVREHKLLSDAAIKASDKKLADAQKRAALAEDQLHVLDEYLKAPPPPNPRCDKAWDIIERAAVGRP